MERMESSTARLDETERSGVITRRVALLDQRGLGLSVSVPDVDAYDRLLKAKLVHLPGAAAVSSSFALSCVKYTTKLPI